MTTTDEILEVNVNNEDDVINEAENEKADEIVSFLDSLYSKCLEGIPLVSSDIISFAYHQSN